MKLNFIFSSVYNRFLGRLIGENYPSFEVLKAYTQELEDRQTELEPALAWLEREFGPQGELPVYVVGTKHSFSSPLTLAYYKDIERAYDVVVHELLHPLTKRVEHEDVYVANHVELYRVMQRMYRELGWDARLEQERVCAFKDPSYRLAWELAEKTQ